MDGVSKGCDEGQVVAARLCPELEHCRGHPIMCHGCDCVFELAEREHEATRGDRSEAAPITSCHKMK